MSCTRTITYYALALSTIGIAGQVHAAQPVKFTERQICKAAIAVVMARNPATMRIDRTAKNVIYLSYLTRDDGKRWRYKCRLEERRILWGSDTGRWRVHPMDSTITYSVTSESLTVTEKFTDGSTNAETFKKSQLGR